MKEASESDAEGFVVLIKDSWILGSACPRAIASGSEQGFDHFFAEKDEGRHGL